MENYSFFDNCIVRTLQVLVLTPGITEQQISDRWTSPLLTLIKATQALDSDIQVFLAKGPYDNQKGQYVSDVVLHHSSTSSASLCTGYSHHRWIFPRTCCDILTPSTISFCYISLWRLLRVMCYPAASPLFLGTTGFAAICPWHFAPLSSLL